MWTKLLYVHQPSIYSPNHSKWQNHQNRTELNQDHTNRENRDLLFHHLARRPVKAHLLSRELAPATAFPSLLRFPRSSLRFVPERVADASFITLTRLSHSAFALLVLHKCETHSVLRHKWSYLNQLQSDVSFTQRVALEGLICTAARASPQWDTSRNVAPFLLIGEFLLHFYRLLHGLTHAPWNDFNQGHYIWLTIIRHL